MSIVQITPSGDIPLPSEKRDRHGLIDGTAIRVVEMCSGVVLITAVLREPGPKLAAELEAWQTLAAHSIDNFPYEE